MITFYSVWDNNILFLISFIPHKSTSTFLAGETTIWTEVPSWKVFRFKRWATCTPGLSWRDGTKRTDDIAPRRGLDRSPTGDQVPPTLSSSNTQAWPPAGVLSTATMPTSNSVVPSNLRPPCPPSHPVKSRPRLWAEYRIISTNHRTARDVSKELLRTQVWRSNRLRNWTHPDTYVPNPVLHEICKCVLWRLPCIYSYILTAV